MASQQTRRHHQPAESYQDEGTNTLSTTPMVLQRQSNPTVLLCILLLVLCVSNLVLCDLVFRLPHSHDFVMCFDCIDAHNLQTCSLVTTPMSVFFLFADRFEQQSRKNGR